MYKNSGFTLLEIIIATIILSLVLLGMLGVFTAGNNWALHFRERSVTSELGKLLADPLQMDVRQDTWNGVNNLNPTVGEVPYPVNPNRIINNKPISAFYTVVDAPTDPFLAAQPGTSVRRSTIRVHWEEAATGP